MREIIKAVDKKNKIPFYLQIEDQLIKIIENKKIKPAEKILNEYELAKIFDVSRPTIRQALNDLEIKGYLVKKKGSGTFVEEKKISTDIMHSILPLSQELKDKGLEFNTKILKKEIIKPTDKLIKTLELEKNEKLYYVERLRVTDNDEPLYLTIFYIREKLCRNFTNHDLENNSSLSIIEKVYGLKISKFKRVLEPITRNYNKDISKILKIKTDEALHYMQTVVYVENNIPVGYYEDFFPGSKSRFIFSSDTNFD